MFGKQITLLTRFGCKIRSDAMNTYCWMMRAAPGAPATIMACANRLLRNGRMPDGQGIVVWICLIVVMLTGCTPY